MQTAQVIALFMPESSVETFTGANSLIKGATALLRDTDGRMRIESVASEDFMEQAMATGCFKQGKAIIDPVSRQVMGYEMEMISHPDVVIRTAYSR